jgi:hypothetical protein
MNQIKFYIAILLITLFSGNSLQAQIETDSLKIINSIGSYNYNAPLSQAPNCEECQEALQLYREAYENKMLFSIDEFLPLVSLIKICEKKYQTCFSENQAKESLKYLRYRAITEYDRQLGDYNLDNYDDFRFLKQQKPIEIIQYFKSIYKTKLSPDCDDCIDLFEKYYDAFKSNKFDSNLKMLVQRCRFQIRDREACEKLKKKMKNEKFNDKILMFCDVCGISRMGLPADVVNKWAFERNFIPKMNKPKPEQVLNNNISREEVFKFDSKWGVRSREGIVFINPEYDKIKPIKINKSVFYLVTKNGKTGICNSIGKELIKPNFDEIIDNETFITNISKSSNQQSRAFGYDLANKMNLIVYRIDGKYGIITNSDTLVSISKAFVDDINFRKNIAVIKSGNKYGFINYGLSSYVLPKYDKLSEFGASENLDFAIFCINNKWGLLNTATALESTKAKYDQISQTEINSIFKVRTGSKNGLINSTGSELINPFFDEIYPFVNLCARVKNNSKWGLIDNNGNLIIEVKYDEILQLPNGTSQVKNNNKWGLIDNKGKIIISPKYDEAFTFIQGKAMVKLNKVQIRINERDEIVYNDFQDFDFNNLKRGGSNMKYEIKKRFEDLFAKVNAKQLYGSMLGVKVSTKEMIDEGINEIRITVEEWLNGSMTKTQLNEFIEIGKNAAVESAFAMALISESLKSSNSSSSSTSGNLSSGSGSGNSSNNNSSQVCIMCKPYDSKGHYINDFDIYKRIYINGRYIKKPGYKPCEICKGTGKCQYKNWNDAPGICDENYTCLRCHGDRFEICKSCDGSGVR